MSSSTIMSFTDLGIPPSSSTVSVKIFDIINDPSQVLANAASFLSPVGEGHENLTCPCYAFLIENTTTKQRVMFDLGPRKDLENGATYVKEAVKAGHLRMPVSKDATEQLEEAGVDLKSISAVIWSHSHADHTGDMSKFPSTTDLVVANSMSLETCETNPWSALVPSDLAGRKIVKMEFKDGEIGGFKAHDYFKDGSLYILDVPGHQTGHTCALARVTPTGFLFLGADACHHAGVLRPTSKLHKSTPCPGDLLAATIRSILPTHIHEPAHAAGEFDLTSRTTPLLSIAEKGYFEDPKAAHESIAKMGDFDANQDVFVILAHDESLVPFLGSLPVLLNDWKAKGWKKDATWAFVDEKNPAFRFH
ncbi:beta-lactamase-like protein [Roridomyces roridus]|uniref:Beta-lactamase-like protein n=1 Tax=Roridomyces roridus TaxID=1738132 RepID=A0AAD7C3J3_9AGAR|nr:beta-lactamase-like protein [Roridomyces roridus]